MAHPKIPHDPSAERAVLGAALLGKLTVIVAAGVAPEHFYTPAHRVVFDACLAVERRSAVVDSVSVTGELRTSGKISRLEGQEAFVSQLLDEVPVVAHVEHYAKTILDKAKLRDWIGTFDKLTAEAYGVSDVGEFVSRAAGEAFRQAQEGTGGSYTRFGEVIGKSAMAAVSRINGGKKSFLGTGIGGLDRILGGGFRAGKVYVIAARPSKGKSALMQQIFEYTGSVQVPGLFFSMEMPMEELGDRALAFRAGIGHGKIQAGELTGAEAQELVRVASRAHGDRLLWVDDRPLQSIAELRMKSRRFVTDTTIPRASDLPVPGIIGIDYGQLARGSAKKRYNNRNDELEEVSKGIKALAKELHVPILVLLQMNREIEKEKRKPLMRDLRDCGQFEQDADLIAFLHQAEETDPLQLIAVKNRSGQNGSIDLQFAGEYMRFTEIEKRYDEPDRRHRS